MDFLFKDKRIYVAIGVILTIVVLFLVWWFWIRKSPGKSSTSRGYTGTLNGLACDELFRRVQEVVSIEEKDPIKASSAASKIMEEFGDCTFVDTKE